MADLTQAQIEDFLVGFALSQGGSAIATRSALVKLADDCGLAAADVVQTHETLDHFRARRGRPGERASVICADGTAREFHEWSGVQMVQRKSRGDLYFMDFGGVAACHFTGGR